MLKKMWVAILKRSYLLSEIQLNTTVNFLVMFQKYIFTFSVFITFLTLHLYSSAYSNTATERCFGTVSVKIFVINLTIAT